jgi:MoaA/NifB/PqqE/SkfB family radical SAM enzyme
MPRPRAKAGESKLAIPVSSTPMKNLQLGIKYLLNAARQQIAYYVHPAFARPTQIVLNLTYRCCLRCQMCDSWKSPAMNELSKEEWQQIILEFSRWLPRGYYIHFTGGEPFLRDDCVDLLCFAAAHGVRTIVNTNGFLIDEVLAKRLTQSGLKYLIISLDGINPETVDSLRGVAGAYKRVTEAIQVVNAYKPKSMIVGVSAVITKLNLDELIPLIEWAETHHVDRVGFHALQPTRRGAVAHYPRTLILNEDLWVRDLEKLDYIIHTLIQLKKQGRPIINSVGYLNLLGQYYANKDFVRNEFKCMVGLNNFGVEPDGKVYFCRQRDHFGNLRTASIQQVWRSFLAVQQRKEIQSCHQRCLTTSVYTRSLSEKFALWYFLAKKQAF